MWREKCRKYSDIMNTSKCQHFLHTLSYFNDKQDWFSLPLLEMSSRAQMNRKRQHNLTNLVTKNDE